MDTRTVIVLVLALGGCAGATYDPTPLPGHAAAALRTEPAPEPESAEDRAEAVVDLTAEACLERAELCEEEREDGLTGMAWSYPDPHVDVPASVWRFPTTQEQEVRSVGVTLELSLSDQVASLERGAGLSYRGDLDP